jgi:hypothetical protein
LISFAEDEKNDDCNHSTNYLFSLAARKDVEAIAGV